MNRHTLEHKTVADLSTEELLHAYEWRLVQEAQESVAAGQGIEVTPQYFADIRADLAKRASR